MIFKNNRKIFSCHFGDDDIIIDKFILNPVHIIPENDMKPNQEIDFYLDDMKNIYLLRLINSNDNCITLSDCYNIRYIIVRLKIDNVSDALKKVISKLKVFNYSRKIQNELTEYNFLNEK